VEVEEVVEVVVGLAVVGLAAVEWKKELTQKKKDLRSP
jgi:hypothetical protein